MTRAADRLIVAGYAGSRGGGDDTWHAVVERALAPESATVAYPDFEALRFQITQAPAICREAEKAEKTQVVALPSWFRSPVPAEPPLPRPLAPSGASGVAVEREQDTAETAGAPSLLAAAGDEPPSLAVKRGIACTGCCRCCLRWRRRAPQEAAEYCHRFEHRWDAADIATILGQALAILEDPAHAALFGENTAAEVPVMGTLTGRRSRRRAVSGVIDRIAVEDRSGSAGRLQDQCPPARRCRRRSRASICARWRSIAPLSLRSIRESRSRPSCSIPPVRA
jgi:ATP-dependent helicase/nuclease subunit A